MNKKRFLSALLVLAMVFTLCPVTAFAADVDVNGITDDTTILFEYQPGGTKNTKTGAYSMPLNPKNGDANNHAQMIFPADFFDSADSSKTYESQSGKTITKLEFFLSCTFSQNKFGNITVKMGTTTAETYASSSQEGTSLFITSGLTTVFDNKQPQIESYDSTGDIMVIELDTPFEYTGGNIVIDIVTHSSNSLSSYASGDSIGFKYQEFDSAYRVGIGCDGWTKNWLPITRMTFEGTERVTVTPGTTTFTANGEEQYPSVTVKDNQTGATLDSTYYDISFSGAGTSPVAAGDYTMTLTFKNGYTGTRTVDFTINPALDPSTLTTIFFKDGSGQAGTATEGAWQMPINLWNGGLHSQMIFSADYYDASDSSKTFAGQSGKSITKLEFILNGTYSESARNSLQDVTVKVGTTTQTKYVDEWTKGVDNLSITEGLQTVFTGKPTITDYDSTHDLLVIEFTTPFVYTGGNIVLDFRSSGTNNISPTTGSAGYNYVQFSDSSMHVGIGADTNSKDWLPFTIFTFQSEKVNVTDVTSGDLIENQKGTVARYPTVEVTDADGNTIDASNYTVSYTTADGTALSGAPTTAGDYIMVLTFSGEYEGIVKKVPFTVQPFSLKDALANVTPETVYVQSVSAVISGASASTGTLPFDASSGAANDHSQMLYPAGFFGSEEGNPTIGSQSGKYITQLEFFLDLSISGETPPSVTVKLATVDQTALTAEYSDADALTTVFEGTPTLLDGTVLVIELDEPFKYDGKAVLVDITLNEKSGIGFIDYINMVKFHGNYWASGDCLAVGDGALTHGFFLPNIRMTFKKAGVTLENCRDNQILTYDGTAKAPTFTLYDNAEGKELDENTDYTVSFNTSDGSAPSAIGQYTMTISFIGAYDGTDAITVSFEIKEPAEAEIEPIEPMVYTGSPLVPGLIVKGDTVLVQGVDYEIVGYASTDGKGYNSTTAPTNAGKYKVTVQITDNGTKEAEFEIVAKGVNGTKPVESTHDLNDAAVTINYDACSTDSAIYDYTYSYGSVSDWFLVNSGSQHIQTIIPVTDPVDHAEGGIVDYLSKLNGKTLRSLTLYYYAQDGWTLDEAALTVKLLEVSAVSLSGQADVTNATVVFAGKVTPTAMDATTEIGKIILEFDKPYTYNGGNLLVDIVGSLTATGTNSNASPVGFYGVTYSSRNQSTTYHFPGQNRSWGGKNTFAPQITFGCEGPDTKNYDVSASMTNATVTWNGSAQAPTVTVADNDRGVTLAEGTDYVVKYAGSTDAPTDAGSYEVTAEFTGNYSGTKTVGTFEIKQGTLPGDDYTLTFTGWHVGKDHGNAPALTGTSVPADASITYAFYSGDTMLDSRPTAVGTYTVKATIAATNNYSEKVIGKTFTISDHTPGAAVTENSVAATCTADGSYEAVTYCTVCNEELSRENVTVPATGHSYKSVVTAPTCTAEGYTTHKCSVCDDTYTDSVVAAPGHTTVIDAAKDATCTETGLTEGSHCSVCNEVLVAQTVIEALGHTPDETVIENKVESSCTGGGSYDEVVYCTVCTAEISRNTVTSGAAGHTEEIIPAVAATCTATGLTEGKKCSVCNAVIVAQTTVDKLPHTEVSHAAKAPTCTEIGWDAYVTCANCDYTTYAEKAATGHNDADDDHRCDNDSCDAVVGVVDSQGSKELSIPAEQQATVNILVTYSTNDSTTLKLGDKELFSLSEGVLKLCGAQVEGIYNVSGSYRLTITVNPCQKMVTVEVKMPDNSIIRRGTYDLLEGLASYTVEAWAYDAGDVKLMTPSYPGVTSSGYTVEETEPGNGTIYNIVTSFADARNDRLFAWTSTYSGNMAVRYKVNDAEDWIVVDAVPETVAVSATEYFYKADVTGLAPATTYQYQIGVKGSESNWSDTYTFTTATVSNNSFTFAALGDTQGTTWNGTPSGTVKPFMYAQAAYNAIAALNPAFILNTGDIVENGTNVNHWNLFFKALGDIGTGTPHFAAIGNHDYWGVTSAENYYFDRYFNHPDNGASWNVSGFINSDLQNAVNAAKETCYSFDYGDVHVIVLNSGGADKVADDNLLLAAQKAWLEQDLESNAHAKWTVVMIHKPVYHRTDLDGTSVEASYALHEVIESKGVDLVIQGHSHLVTRTYPMSGGEIVAKNAIDTITGGSGTVYITVGSTTTNHDVLGDPNIEEMAVIATPAIEQATYATFEVSASALKVTVQQLNGLVLDQFTISGATNVGEHSHTTVTTAPTCTAEGYTTYTCDGCDDKYVSNYTAALGHTWTDATCTAPKTCSVCGETEGEALGHTEVVDKAVAPTCTETGLTEGKHCSVCNEVLVAQTVVDALGHSYDDGVVTTEPTCTETGVKTFTCTRDNCGHTYVEDVAANGHWEVREDTKAATCTENGEFRTYCLNCNLELTSGHVIEKTGHTMTHHAAVEPDCTTDGSLEYWSCAACGKNFADNKEYSTNELQSVVVSATGHTWVNATCTASKTCSACGETEGEALGHEFGDYTAIDGSDLEQATCTHDGCDATDTKVSDSGVSDNVVTVVPDASEEESGEGETESNIAQVTIGKELLDSIADTTKGWDLHVDGGILDLVFNNGALGAIVNRYKDDEDVTDVSIVVTDKTEAPAEGETLTSLLFDISLSVNGEPDGITFGEEAGENYVTVTIPLARLGDLSNKTVEVYYVPDEGDNQLMDSEVVDGNVVFQTTHFSEYEVRVVDTDSGEGGDSGEVTPTGTTVSGTAVSWNDSDDAVYLLYSSTIDDAAIKAEWAAENPEYTALYTATKSGITAVDVSVNNQTKSMQSQEFTFTGVAAGTYKLVILKPGKYVPKIVEITVGTEAVNVGQQKLWLYGDVDYSGSVNADDVMQIRRYIANMTSMFAKGDTQEKADRFSAANITAIVGTDSTINADDVMQIRRHIANMSSAIKAAK